MTTTPLPVALAKGLCPRCRQGHMFKYPIYRIDKMTQMHKNCPLCNAPFEPEPGFYYGAMYISYAFTVAIFIITFVVLYNFLNDPPLLVYAFTVIGLTVLFLPFSFRYSRILYLHAFGPVGYNEQTARTVAERK